MPKIKIINILFKDFKLNIKMIKYYIINNKKYHIESNDI